MGQDYRSLFVHSRDGLRLHVRIYERANDEPLLPIVCLPGLTRNSSEFHLLALALLERGAANLVVAVDYRGRGLSDHDPEPAHYTPQTETVDLMVVLAELAVTAAIFVGVSRGGLIAMGLAALRPDLVRAMVLNDIGPAVEREGLLRIKGYVGHFAPPAHLEEGAATLRRVFADRFPNLTEVEWRDWAGTIWSEEAGALRLAYDPALVATLASVNESDPIPDLWLLWDKLGKVPTLAIRGGMSDLLSAATLAEMDRRHPDLATIEVPDEGHTPFMHRPALVDRIASFIARANALAAARAF